jgi:molybdenum cofactor cytidylyltransferase
VRVLLNKIDSPARLKAGRTIAELLSSESRVQAVVLAALRADPPVLEVYLRQAAVILAAGGSSRLGQPKQLVLWRGRPLVWHAARAALGAGLDPVIVVVGAHAADVRAALDSLPVSVVENPNWRSGQSSSVKAGLAVVREAEATVFLLTDTPYVDSDLVAALSEAHRKSLAPIVAPRAAGRRANPVLFDRLTYPALFQIEGDQGGRDLFDRFEVHWVDWQAEILLDVDDQADLARMKAQDRAHDSRQES